MDVTLAVLELDKRIGRLEREVQRSTRRVGRSVRRICCFPRSRDITVIDSERA